MAEFLLVSLKFSNSKDENVITMINLGILYLKEISVQNHLDLDILDGDYHNYTDEEILSIILKNQPKVVGFSPFQNTMERTITMIKTISLRIPDTIIVLGGVHASLTANEIMNDLPEIDYIFKGEVGLNFIEFLKNISNNQPIIPAKIPGLVFRHNETIITNPAIHNIDIEKMPNLGHLQSSDKGVVSLISSRGCPSRCSYCCSFPFLKLTENNRYRYQSPDKVINDIKEIVEKNAERKLIINFYDDDFIGFSDTSIRRAEEIADKILQLDIQAEFGFSCQAKAIVKAGVHFWEKWKKAGLMNLFCGFESGNDEDLIFYNKSSSVTDAINASQILKKCNIHFTMGFIMFNPSTDKERIIKNIKFLQTVEKSHTFDHYTKELFPYPYTPAFNELQKENLVNYEKIYLKTTIKYKDSFIEKFKNALCAHRITQMPIDKCCYKFDDAIINNRKSIEIDYFETDINEELIKEYKKYIKIRSEKIISFIYKMLHCPENKLSSLSNKMNASLIKDHNKFVSNLTKTKHKKSFLEIFHNKFRKSK